MTTSPTKFASQNTVETDRWKRAAPSTAWRKGQSGNPGGRPRKTLDEKALVEACRAKAPHALAVLERLMTEADKDSVKLNAALAILERGFGRPVQRQELGKAREYEHKSQAELERLAIEKAAKLGFKISLPERAGKSVTDQLTDTAPAAS